MRETILDLRRRLGMLLIAVCLTGCAGRYPIYVWVDENISPGEESAREYYDHPCGMVKEIEVSRIPPYGSDEYISGTEKVIEFDDGGNIVRYWAMPVDSYVMAIEGDTIIVRYFREALAISTSGVLAKAAPVTGTLRRIECPDRIAVEFGVSAYDGCWAFNDLRTGAFRYLAFEDVCT